MSANGLSLMMMGTVLKTAPKNLFFGKGIFSITGELTVV